MVLIESGPQENEEHDRTTKHDDYEVFHATNKWQTVKDGQAIPRGLHVQIDLQTGEKRAKLMDDTPNVESNGNNVLTSKKKFIKIDRNLISKQKLKDALKDFKDKFHHENEMEDDVIVEHGTTSSTVVYLS